jgi:hypothetical protein
MRPLTFWVWKKSWRLPLVSSPSIAYPRLCSPLLASPRLPLTPLSFPPHFKSGSLIYLLKLRETASRWSKLCLWCLKGKFWTRTRLRNWWQRDCWPYVRLICHLSPRFDIADLHFYRDRQQLLNANRFTACLCSSAFPISEMIFSSIEIYFIIYTSSR